MGAALDLAVGSGTTNLFVPAAVGTEVWTATRPRSLQLLGMDHFPWYPKAKAYLCRGGDWADPIARMAGDLGIWLARRHRDAGLSRKASANDPAT